MPAKIPIQRLSAGGVITTYRCQAACDHCMYGCSSTADPGYITEDSAVALCEHLRRLGRPSMHIGGGEPFLDPQGLIKLIKVIRHNGMSIDFIETNAGWITGGDRDRQILNDVWEANRDYLMVSADPFHVAYIPFWKPLALIRLMEEKGVPYFVWQQRYFPMLSRLDPQKKYDPEELQQTLGYDVIQQCAREYGMGFNGRALKLLRKMGKRKSPEDFLKKTPCTELTRSGHFHVDLYGRYVPPGCTGMGVRIEDLNNELNPAQYPVLSRLLTGGLAKLWEYAVERGFQPLDEGYVSSCDLCFCMRKYLISTSPNDFPDLTPPGYYSQDF